MLILLLFYCSQFRVIWFNDLLKLISFLLHSLSSFCYLLNYVVFLYFFLFLLINNTLFDCWMGLLLRFCLKRFNKIFKSDFNCSLLVIDFSLIWWFLLFFTLLFNRFQFFDYFVHIFSCILYSLDHFVGQICELGWRDVSAGY